MIEHVAINKQRPWNSIKKTTPYFLVFNHSSISSNEQQKLPIHFSKNAKAHHRNRLTKFIFPTRSPIKLHQLQLSTDVQTKTPLREQVAKLNQRAVDVQSGIEQSLSSLNTQRLQYLTGLSEKTRDLEIAATDFESSSSKYLKQELNKTKKLAFMFKIAITLCLVLFSFMAGYMIVQLMRSNGTL